MTPSVPPDSSRRSRLEEVLGEYMQRLDRGEAVDREQFLARHPEWAEELRSDPDAVPRPDPGEAPVHEPLEVIEVARAEVAPAVHQGAGVGQVAVVVPVHPPLDPGQEATPPVLVV